MSTSPSHSIDSALSEALDAFKERADRFRERRALMLRLFREDEEDREWLQALETVFGDNLLKALVGDAANLPFAPHQGSAKTVKATRRTRNGRLTWTSFIAEQLPVMGGRASYEEMRSAAKGTELEASLAGSQKGFHSAIAKLAERSVIVRHKGWLFTPEAFSEHSDKVQTGESEDRPAPGYARASPLSDIVLAFIKSSPAGVEGKQVIDHLLTVDEFKDAIRRNSTGVYNVLARLVNRGTIKKVGTTYLAQPEDKSGGPG